LTDWLFGLHIFDRLLLVVVLGIPVIVNRDYSKLLLLYVYVNSTLRIAQHCGDSDNRIRVSKPRRAKE